MITVRNKCVKCKHKWKDHPGIFSTTSGACPKCGSFYFKWSSYNLDKKKYFLDFP